MTEITREQLDRYRYPGMHFSDKGGLEVTVARGMFEHLLVIAEAHLDEQSRIDAAVARERERCAGVAEACAREQERLARNASKVGRGTVFASWSGGHHAANHIAAAIRTPTPVTEEGE